MRHGLWGCVSVPCLCRAGNVAWQNLIAFAGWPNAQLVIVHPYFVNISRRCPTGADMRHGLCGCVSVPCLTAIFPSTLLAQIRQHSNPALHICASGGTGTGLIYRGISYNGGPQRKMAIIIKMISTKV